MDKNALLRSRHLNDDILTEEDSPRASRLRDQICGSRDSLTDVINRRSKKKSEVVKNKKVKLFFFLWKEGPHSAVESSGHCWYDWCLFVYKWVYVSEWVCVGLCGCGFVCMGHYDSLGLCVCV